MVYEGLREDKPAAEVCARYRLETKGVGITRSNGPSESMTRHIAAQLEVAELDPLVCHMTRFGAPIMNMPTQGQEQRARWDHLLLDLEHRAEQVRQLKTYEGWRLAIPATIAAFAALFAAGGVVLADRQNLGRLTE